MLYFLVQIYTCRRDFEFFQVWPFAVLLRHGLQSLCYFFNFE